MYICTRIATCGCLLFVYLYLYLSFGLGWVCYLLSFTRCHSWLHGTQDWGSAADWLRLGPMLDPSASQHGGGGCSAAEGHPSGPGPSRGVPCRVLGFQRRSGAG